MKRRWTKCAEVGFGIGIVGIVEIDETASERRANKRNTLYSNDNGISCSVDHQPHSDVYYELSGDSVTTTRSVFVGIFFELNKKKFPKHILI